MNLNRILKMVIGVVTIVVAFIMYPLVLTASAAIVGHTYIATFTGLGDVSALGPLVIFISMLFGGGTMLWSGAKGGGGSGGGMKSVIMVVGGLITVVIGLLLFPTILDQAYIIITDANIDDYTGLADIASIGPLILYVGMLFGGAFLSWTGLGQPGRKRLG